jgi:uncharacterized protein
MFKPTVSDDAITFAVRVQPRASKSGVVGEFDGALKIRLAAPPVDGEANEELIRLLAKLLDTTRDRITIISGRSSKNKIVRVSGISVENVEKLLAEALTK